MKSEMRSVFAMNVRISKLAESMILNNEPMNMSRRFEKQTTKLEYHAHNSYQLKALINLILEFLYLMKLGRLLRTTILSLSVCQFKKLSFKD